MAQQNFDTAFERVRHLVADFQQHEKAYLSPAYSEQDVRKDFIDKFWIALGWDVNHEQQTNPNEREVKVESSVQVEGRRKKADYAFLASNFRDVRFFVEAKKPARNIDNADDYFQTIRYGWNAQAPLSILTDFEQFRVLDCRYKPDIETALNRALPKLKLHYTEYADIEKFREIYYLFSREAVISGKLEKFAADLPKPTGKAAQRKLFGVAYKSVDEDFLQELDELRDELAHSFKNRNPHLDGEDLTEATQRTLDRLVFMRFLEDKLIEPEAIVEKLGERGAAWADFIAASERMNKIYNGIIFKPHFIDRADFIVDERTFAGVRERLAHTNTVYNFNYIPIHVLGSIYERFLGKVIVATDKRARVEEKPEVRKAGGVYYTPEYIVRYIVEQTIGRLIEGKTPEEIASMRFADIACGSGSFLLGVYDELLRYHTAYYNEPKNRRKALKAGCIEIPDGSLRLSLNQRKDILLNNIYGVDLDAQAVEVAQLSLFLKLLEDETTASAKGFQLQFRETMLPSLDKNVIHGNSLIGWDIGGGLFSDEEERKLFPMDFEQSFPEVMRRGGFDAIVGNPPYVRPHNLSKDNKEYFWQHYRSFTHKSDLYCCFIEKATSLLKEEGMLSYIVSNGWLRLNSFQSLRRHVLDNYEVLQLVELPFKVFAEANVNADVFVFKKEWFSDREANNITILEGRFAEGKIQFQLLRVIPQKAFESTFENVFDTSISPVTEEIKNKMRRGENIGNVFDIRFGLKTGDDSRFLHSINGLHAEDRPLLRGEDVKRYFYEYKGEYVWYVPERMRRHRQTARPGERERFEQPKVLVKDTSTDFAGTYDDQNFYVKDVLIVTPKVDVPQMGDLRFLTALINSRALRFYYRTTFKTLHVQSGELGSLPLPPINFSDKADRARHDRMVNLVEQMLAAKRQLQTVRTDRDRNHYENKCAALDRQIDALVYELYELTPAEIAIVEESAL